MSVMLLVLLVSVMASLSQSQILGDPPGEPWQFIIAESCGKKNVNIRSAWQDVQDCYATIPPSRSDLSFCTNRNKRDNCLKPYYEELKKCFPNDDVDDAFDIQEESIDFICEDNQKRYKELKNGNAMSCAPKLTDSTVQQCWREASKMYDTDIMDLFSDDNCKLMMKRNQCMLDSVKSCSMILHDFVKDQFEDMLKKKCDYPNGATTISAPVIVVGFIAFFVLKLF